mmetsp:Transcript_4962/g.14857  ORF Transcript_4962/g.14857 Transcript_4962/m.14857 type:complete len:271 (+) Transcript_4962:2631-3443(+)
MPSAPSMPAGEAGALLQTLLASGVPPVLARAPCRWEAIIAVRSLAKPHLQSALRAAATSRLISCTWPRTSSLHRLATSPQWASGTWEARWITAALPPDEGASWCRLWRTDPEWSLSRALRVSTRIFLSLLPSLRRLLAKFEMPCITWHQTCFSSAAASCSFSSLSPLLELERLFLPLELEAGPSEAYTRWMTSSLMILDTVPASQPALLACLQKPFPASGCCCRRAITKLAPSSSLGMYEDSRSLLTFPLTSSSGSEARSLRSWVTSTAS